MSNSQEINIDIGIDAILKSGYALLEEHQWKKAQRYFDTAIEIAPQNAYSYLGRLLVTLKLPDIDSLINSPRVFTGSENYKKAYLHADENLKNKLDNCVIQYQARCEKDYQHACSLLEKAVTKDDFYECSGFFYKLGNYKDSSKKREYCSDRFSELLNSSPVNPKPTTKVKQPQNCNPNDKKKWTTSRIVKLVFIVLFAISTIGFCCMPLSFDIKDDALEQLFIALMFVDAGLWVVSLFGFLVTSLLDSIKKNHPEKYARLFPSKENTNFFKKIWESPLILMILTFVLLIAGEIICVALNNITFTLIYIVIEAICIIIGLILKNGKYGLSKRWFCAVVIGIIVATMVISLSHFMPTNNEKFNPDKCYWCEGEGFYMTEKGGKVYKCSHCNGTGKRN